MGEQNSKHKEKFDDGVCCKCGTAFDLNKHGPVTGVCGHSICEECGNPEGKVPIPWYNATLRERCPTCTHYNAFVGAGQNWAMRKLLIQNGQLKTNETELIMKHKELEDECKKSRQLVKQFKDENEKLRSELQNAVLVSQRKTMQLDKVSSKIDSLKNELRRVASESVVSEKENVKAIIDENEVDDVALLTVEWNNFKRNLEKLHERMSTLLNQCTSTGDSVFRSTGLETARKMNEVIFEVRGIMYTATEKCVMKLKKSLDSSAHVVYQNQDSKHAADTKLLD